MTASQDADKPHLDRIAIALERLADHFAPAPAGPADLNAGAAFVWRPDAGGPNSGLALAVNRERAPLDLLLGVERQRDILMTNTARFAKGAPANNALLWGARGTGKSALIKAVHATLAAKHKRLKLVEAAREDLPRLGELLAALEGSDARVIVFIDDLGFEQDEPSARALKPVLEGGLAGRPENVIVYATSNRRHLMARDPNENLPGDLMWADTAEERLSLADRFGLWLGFHAMDQDLYLAIVRSYAARFGLDSKDVEERALAWSNMRGARSGRTAWQFILALAAALDKPIKF
jgi:predicted AAA+ superfamily ATPase